MKLKPVLKKITPEFIQKIYRHYSYRDESVDRFTFDSSAEDARENIVSRFGYNGDLLNCFSDNRSQLNNKWHHYIPIYDRYFSPYRNRKIKILEIGVCRGGSLQMWRNYFGPEAVIYGIDVLKSCRQYDGIAGQVRLGSQTDTDFLQSVVDEMGGIDIVIDDGSHQMTHIPVSLKYLFPKLNDGGIYLIEDLHTAYWKSFGGGYGTKSNLFNMVRDIIDDMHHWYHNRNIRQAAISTACTGIHIHDSVLVLEKNRVYPPTHSKSF